MNFSLNITSSSDTRLVLKLEEVLRSQSPSWLREGVINIKLVDDAEIKALNSKYSDNDYPTDVLSFSYIENGEPAEGELGDIAISAETARKQAEQGRITLAEELANLTLHGVLHIFGFDHATPQEQQQMLLEHQSLVDLAGIKAKEFNWE